MAARDSFEMAPQFFKIEDDVILPCSRVEALAQLAGSSRLIRQTLLGDLTITTTFGVVNMAAPGELPLLYDTLATNQHGSIAKLWRTCTEQQARAMHAWVLDKAINDDLRDQACDIALINSLCQPS